MLLHFMKTEILHVDAQHPQPAAIRRAAEVLRAGGLVAFPTETVYGLGANALDALAVQRIFRAKGRPPENPVIVHVADPALAMSLVTDWPEQASTLVQRFWPGPLTLVLRRASCIPDQVTAGGPTVGIRAPAHPVALALLRAAAVPIAAPSANLANRLSPTRAEHVLAGLAGRIELILDGGPTPGGLESTVLDLTVQPPRILRPGLISPQQLREVLGDVVLAADGVQPPGRPLPSPGRMLRHYSPAVPLMLSDQPVEQALRLSRQGMMVGVVAFGEQHAAPHPILLRVLPLDPRQAAALLYATLFELEQAGVQYIVCAAPPSGEDWLAVRDRLRRASASEQMAE